MMSGYRAKIRSLQDKISKLKEKELALIKKRKAFIGDLGEQFNLLTFSDECLVGLLNEYSETLSASPQKIVEYEREGKILLGRKSKCFEAQTGTKSLGQSNSHEAAPHGA